ncbi:MAG: type I DNA topoisomerase [Candidatus Sungbacteria bacterium]|nr:type I DNA topoisomerase [Candidatus Sungbacteria bacterium]
MAKSLVIVESPTKARTISRFLGSDFIVESSYGHVRDLPKSDLGIDVEKNFEPRYIIPLKSRKNVNQLKKEAKSADKIILATDEDREGEAIAWHLISALGLEDRPGDNIERIVFHEITERAINDALKNPRDIDLKQVDAQQARRILDRLVGYKLSPFLWKKMYRGLSAGRVQSVAVRLIVEREREIQNFKTKEYWSIVASLLKTQTTRTENQQHEQQFEANLVKIGDKTLDKFDIASAEESEKIVKNLENAEWTINEVEKKAVSKNPLPPYMTSTIQQDAFRRLGFSSKQTMMFAQQLYEGIELGDEGSTGLITYMRTDSLNLSEDSLRDAAAFLKKELGDRYAPASPRRFKTTSRGAQEAHEAIRPTDPRRTPESIKKFLDQRQFRLYDMIWRRFIASQMPAAIFDATSIDIAVATSYQLPATSYTFRATGQVMKFDGFLKIYPMKFSEAELPELAKNDRLECRELKPLQHFTQPPPRFSEATLVKTLEKNGIGRPSTYAPIISTILARKYVERHERRYLKPTEVGFLVNDMLVEHFPEIVDIQFTAKMEEELDEIAEGKMEWQPVIREFYEPFAKHLESKYEEVKKHEIAETTDEICEKCGKPMIVKLGRFGKFLACSGFPDCKTTKTLKQEPQTIGMKCPKCAEPPIKDGRASPAPAGGGDVIMRRTRRGKVFFGCSRYPNCDFASWTNPLSELETKEKSA